MQFRGSAAQAYVDALTAKKVTLGRSITYGKKESAVRADG